MRRRIRRLVPLLCVLLAGCASAPPKVAPPPPVTAVAPPAAAVTPPAPPLPDPPPAADPSSVLESLDPEIWQDLLELDPDAALFDPDPAGDERPPAR